MPSPAIVRCCLKENNARETGGCYLKARHTRGTGRLTRPWSVVDTAVFRLLLLASFVPDPFSCLKPAAII
jgi:hypothetical protein